jgi:hypothetical protein
MNAPAFALPLIGYNKLFNYFTKKMKHTFGASEALVVTSTYQFDDYNKYAITIFSGAKRLKRRETVFIKDCKKAYTLGEKLVRGQGGQSGQSGQRSGEIK